MALTPAQQVWLQANPGREAFVEANPNMDYGGMNAATAERISGWGRFLGSGNTATPSTQTLQANQALGDRTGSLGFGQSPNYDWATPALAPYQTPGALTATPQTVAPYRPTQQAAMDPATAAANNALAARTGGPAFGAGAPVQQPAAPGGVASAMNYLNQNRNAPTGTPPPLPQVPSGGSNALEEWYGITDPIGGPIGIDDGAALPRSRGNRNSFEPWQGGDAPTQPRRNRGFDQQGFMNAFLQRLQGMGAQPRYPQGLQGAVYQAMQSMRRQPSRQSWRPTPNGSGQPPGGSPWGGSSIRIPRAPIYGTGDLTNDDVQWADGHWVNGNYQPF